METQKALIEKLLSHQKDRKVIFNNEEHLVLLGKLASISSYNVYGWHAIWLDKEYELRFYYRPKEKDFMVRIVNWDPKVVEETPSWDSRIVLECIEDSFEKVRLEAEKFMDLKGYTWKTVLEKDNQNTHVFHWRSGYSSYNLTH